MALQAFADDSGSSGGNKDGDFYVIAGYAAPTDQWALFSDEWDQECASEPATPDFKMAKAMRPIGRPEGYTWTEEQRSKRLENLAAIVNRRTAMRVSCVIRKSAYETIVKGRIPAVIDSPYFLAFFTVMAAAGAHMDKIGAQGTIDWVFDDQGKIGRKVNAFYDFIRRDADPNLKALSARPPYSATTVQCSR